MQLSLLREVLTLGPFGVVMGASGCGRVGGGIRIWASSVSAGPGWPVWGLEGGLCRAPGVPGWRVQAVVGAVIRA